ncbi:MAG TPA: response regulator transcription factor [Jatrophihabitans sp.]|nr:response regulator transcription factor [Jatrophihabitans sp.]
MSEQILVIDDEPRLRALLVHLLETAGHQITTADSGAAGLRAALVDDYDLIVLDLNLPDISGDDVLRTLLKVKPSSRVLVLSSVPEIGRQVGVLESGAVDFVSKPFVNADLLARVRLRLASAPRAHTTARLTKVPITSDVYLDVQRRELTMGTSRVPLSTREFALLDHLLRRRGSVCTRQELLADVWGVEFDPGTNVVDVCIRRLRAKLSSDSIQTVRNAGYRLAAS